MQAIVDSLVQDGLRILHEHSAACLGSVAQKSKKHPHAVLHRLGAHLVHSHLPSDRLEPGCRYCRRHGNVFAR